VIRKKELLEQLKTVPDKPGVYVFKDASGKIIYVGKARSLKKRMRSYFQKTSSSSPKAKLMVEKIADLDFYLTHSEVEALILECNLIKEYHPDFNISLRDDKSYPSLAITLADDFPRIAVTRKLGIEGAKYFGPYTSAQAIRETLDTLRRIFPVRVCRGRVPGKQRGSPCLNYHIEKCLGPCTGQVDRGEYRKMINRICLFLEGKQERVISQLEKEMKEAAKELEFEKAARLRNRIQAGKQVLEKQKIISKSTEDRDVFGLFSNAEFVCFEVFFVRGGKLMGSESFILDRDEQVSEAEFFSSFLKQFYLRAAFVPRTVILPGEITDQEIIEKWLTERRGKRVNLIVPKRGEKKKLVELAKENTQASLELLRLKKEFQKERTMKALAQLKEELKLPVFPYRIECFDISTIGGKESVGSMVVFENGEARNQDYKRFKIKSVDGQDDFAMMAEVIKRRFAKHKQEAENAGSKFGVRPDLVVVDGGKPQLSAALKSLDELDLEGIPVIAIAKREEEIYLPFAFKPISLPRSSPGLKLIQAIRDEAHRFAIGYHRGLREKRVTESVLDQIPGVGDRRKQILIQHFGTPKAVLEAGLQELMDVPHLPATVAHDIYVYLHDSEDRDVVIK